MVVAVTSQLREIFDIVNVLAAGKRHRLPPWTLCPETTALDARGRSQVVRRHELVVPAHDPHCFVAFGGKADIKPDL